MARKKKSTFAQTLGVGAVCVASVASTASGWPLGHDSTDPVSEAVLPVAVLAMSDDEARAFQEILSAGGPRRQVAAGAHDAIPPELGKPLGPAAIERPVAPEAAPTLQRELSPELTRLRDRMKDCSEYFSQIPENAGERSPWGVMHSLIAYGADTELMVGSRRVNAIGWLCWNGACRGQKLLYLHNNRIAAHVGKPGMQGHGGQFLAMLAQSRVKPETSMRVDGRELTVADFIAYEQATCEPKTELTFKLIALSYYLESDTTWVDDRGHTWSIPRLIQEELAQPVVGAACGGTHRMTGYSYALRMRERDGKPLDGQWARAKAFVDDYHEYTFRLQNADGSFSTNWFAGRGDWGDAARRIETTGHIFEWLAYSLPEDQLLDPRMVRAAEYLTNTLVANRKNEIEIGPKGHALHGLNIYLDRAFDTQPEYITPEVAVRRRSGEHR